ncbi:hypothetical protein EMPS_06249 [Entomortierella parvispora]|uniref:Ankyrin n=1 Tax=Entomortierella parvispora TaxID=205924 RepID=A0A9P3HC65_9FUNG|nr:hypothetical protein EMPS_06249 [Entomortierella parvispora]
MTDYNTDYNALLMAACKDDNLDILEKVLAADASAIDINHTDESGNTALHYAATNASTGCLEILMFYDGINVNGVDPTTGDTPLHRAATYPDAELALEMVQILITRGRANVSIENKDHKTAVDLVNSSTHQLVKDYLERAALGTHIDASPADDSDDD